MREGEHQTLYLNINPEIRSLDIHIRMGQPIEVKSPLDPPKNSPESINFPGLVTKTHESWPEKGEDHLISALSRNEEAIRYGSSGKIDDIDYQDAAIFELTESTKRLHNEGLDDPEISELINQKLLEAAKFSNIGKSEIRRINNYLALQLGLN